MVTKMTLVNEHSDQSESVQAARTRATEKPNYPISQGGLIRFLWSNIDRENLPDVQLEYLACGTESMEISAMNLGKTLAGVASLIQTEIGLRDEGKVCGGAFQPHGIVEFLCGMAETADTIRESLAISSEAEAILRDRWEKRARALGFKHEDAEENGNG